MRRRSSTRRTRAKTPRKKDASTPQKKATSTPRKSARKTSATVVASPSQQIIDDLLSVEPNTPRKSARRTSATVVISPPTQILDDVLSVQPPSPTMESPDADSDLYPVYKSTPQVALWGGLMQRLCGKGPVLLHGSLRDVLNDPVVTVFKGPLHEMLLQDRIFTTELTVDDFDNLTGSQKSTLAFGSLVSRYVIYDTHTTPIFYANCLAYAASGVDTRDPVTVIDLWESQAHGFKRPTDRDDPDLQCMNVFDLFIAYPFMITDEVDAYLWNGGFNSWLENSYLVSDKPRKLPVIRQVLTPWLQQSLVIRPSCAD